MSVANGLRSFLTRYVRWKSLLFLALGAAVGFGYYRVIGCATGACPITGNPYIATTYGGLIGFLLSVKPRPRPDK